MTTTTFITQSLEPHGTKGTRRVLERKKRKLKVVGVFIVVSTSDLPVEGCVHFPQIP